MSQLLKKRSHACGAKGRSSFSLNRLPQVILVFFHIREFGPHRPLWRARFNLLVARSIGFRSNRNNEDSTSLRLHLMA
ncbi:hypothetical protein KP509_20G047300 [Ceratopteris richardii]|uniref:Uncharacterized protein n=1 Tax=Ceratopteris richardii TaxID=49495 RepID=A0A8T2SIC4_CERRI|nr:hypothetical protein KP509_20G047300 [Ceratopteris richardii]